MSTPVPSRKKPDFDKATAVLKGLNENPKAKKKSPIQICVERDFDELIKAVNDGHSLSAICAYLSRCGIRSTPKVLRYEMYRWAQELNRVPELPEKLIPQEPKNKDVSKTEPALESELESDFENVIDQNSVPESNGSNSKKSRFNTRELKFNEVSQ